MNYNSKLIKAIFYLIISFIVLVGLYFYQSSLSFLLFSLLFGFLFNPLIVIIEKLGLKRTTAVLLFYSIFFVVITFMVIIFIPILLKQVESLTYIYIKFINDPNYDYHQLSFMVNLENIYVKAQEVFPFIDFDNYRISLLNKLSVFLSGIPGSLISYSGNVVRVFLYLLSVPVISFFLLKDRIYLWKTIYSWVPNRYFEMSIIIVEKIKNTIGTYLRALLIETFFVAILCSTILTILGVKYGIVIGCIAGLLNVIPYLGPFFGFIVGGLTVIFTGGSTTLFIATLAGMIGANLVDNSLIYPIVMGSKTKIHPSVIILTVLAGGFSFGIIGMLLAVPILFLTTTLLKVLYKSLKDFELL